MYWPYRGVGRCASLLSVGIVSNLFGHTDQFSDPFSIRMQWVGELLVAFSTNSYHLFTVELAFKGVLALASAVKGL